MTIPTHSQEIHLEPQTGVRRLCAKVLALGALVNAGLVGLLYMSPWVVNGDLACMTAVIAYGALVLDFKQRTSRWTSGSVLLFYIAVVFCIGAETIWLALHGPKDLPTNWFGYAALLGAAPILAAICIVTLIFAVGKTVAYVADGFRSR